MGQNRRGLHLFRRSDARPVRDTGLLRPPELDQAARDALPEFFAAGGSTTTLLYGDPDNADRDNADGGGMSLVWVRFDPDYRLPRHSHSVDCLYYIVSGSIRMGNRTLGPREGFFVSAGAPYGYAVGPEGVELLEFRATSCVDSKIRETADGWQRILAGIRARASLEVP